MSHTGQLIVQYWLDLGQPPVDAKLLKAIQSEFADRSHRDILSPASIARLLADAGGDLRHPEVIEFDAEWRQERVGANAGKFEELLMFVSGDVIDIEMAEVFITKLETLRRQSQNESDDSSLSELRRLAIDARQTAQAMAKNPALDIAFRAAQREIDEWLKVWLQTPALFAEWLELRKRSDDFQRNLLTGTRKK